MKIDSYPLQKIVDYVQYLNGTVRDENGMPYAFMYPYGLPSGTDIGKYIKWHKDNDLPRLPIINEFAYVDIQNHPEFNVTYSLETPNVSFVPLAGFAFNGTFKGTLNIAVKNTRITTINAFGQVRGAAPYNVYKTGAYEYVNFIGNDVFTDETEEQNFVTTNFQPHDCSGAFEYCSRLKRTPDNINWDVKSLNHHEAIAPHNPIAAHLMAWFADGCTALEEVPSYKNATDREDVTNTIVFDTTYGYASMQQMCSNCKNLRYFGPVLDFTLTDMTLTTDYMGDRNAPIFAGIFLNCDSLVDVRIKGLHGKDFDFTQGHFGIPNIDKDSIEYILNNLISDGENHILTFASTHRDEISAAAIANAQSKGFNIEWVTYFDRFNSFNTSDWVFNTAQQPDMQYTLEDDGKTLSITKFKPNRWIVRTNNTDTSNTYMCQQTAGWTVRLNGLEDNASLFETGTGKNFYQHSEVGGSGDCMGNVLGVGIFPSSMDIAERTSWWFPTENANCTQGQLIELPFTAFVWDSMTYRDGSTVQLGSETTALRGSWAGAGYNAYGKVKDGIVKVIPDWLSFPTPYGNWQSTIGIFTNDSRIDADGYITLENPIKISLIKERMI